MESRPAFYMALFICCLSISEGVASASQAQSIDTTECVIPKRDATVLEMRITQRLASSYTSYSNALNNKQRILDKEWDNEKEFRRGIIEASLQVVLPGAGKLLGRLADRYIVTGASLEIYRIGVVTLSIYDNGAVQGTLTATNRVVARKLADEFYGALGSLSSSETEDEVVAFIRRLERSYQVYTDLIGQSMPCLSESEKISLYESLSPISMNTDAFEQQIDRQIRIFRWVAKAGSGFSAGCGFIFIDGQDGKSMPSIRCNHKIYQAGWKADEHGTKRMALFDCFEGTNCSFDGWIPEEFQALAIAKMRRKMRVSELPTF